MKVSDVKLRYPHGMSTSWDGTLRIWDLESRSCIRIIEHRLHLEHLDICRRWIVTADEDSTLFVFSMEDCLDPSLPVTIGVRSEERRQIGVRCLNTYSGDIVAVRVEEGVMVTLLNTGDTRDTIQGRVVIQVTYCYCIVICFMGSHTFMTFEH